jgi:hypothetical protein
MSSVDTYTFRPGQEIDSHQWLGKLVQRVARDERRNLVHFGPVLPLAVEFNAVAQPLQHYFLAVEEQDAAPRINVEEGKNSLDHQRDVMVGCLGRGSV